MLDLPNVCVARQADHKVKNAKHRPETCNEIMLRDKLGVFVSRISPLYEQPKPPRGKGVITLDWS